MILDETRRSLLAAQDIAYELNWHWHVDQGTKDLIHYGYKRGSETRASNAYTVSQEMIKAGFRRREIRDFWVKRAVRSMLLAGYDEGLCLKRLEGSELTEKLSTNQTRDLIRDVQANDRLPPTMA